jgi:hypothetical protein
MGTFANPTRVQWLDMSAASLIVVTINAITSPQVAGAVAITGTVTPAGSLVEAAPLIGGVPGTFVPMTVTAGTWSGSVTMVSGTGVQIRARATEEPAQLANSNVFNVT